MELGSFGHAFGFSVIAIEEVSKALFYLFDSYISMDLGIPTPKEFTSMRIDYKWEGRNPVYIHELKLVLQKAVHHVEEIKSGSITSLRGEEINRIVDDRVKLGGSQEEIVSDVTETILEKYFATHNERIEETMRIEDAELLQKKKEVGLYVDIKGDQVTSPKDIGEEETIEQLRMLSEYLQDIKEIERIIQQMPPELAPIALEKAREVSMKYSEDEEN